MLEELLKIEQTPKGKLLVTFHHDTILEFQNNGKKGKLVLQFFIIYAITVISQE